RHRHWPRRRGGFWRRRRRRRRRRRSGGTARRLPRAHARESVLEERVQVEIVVEIEPEVDRPLGLGAGGRRGPRLEPPPRLADVTLVGPLLDLPSHAVPVGLERDEALPQVGEAETRRRGAGRVAEEV